MNIIKNKSSGIKLNNRNGLLGILLVYVFIPLVFIISIIIAENICPTDWVPYNSKCYQVVVGGYKSYTYQQALQDCNNSNATLGSVPDNNTLQFLASQIQQKWMLYPEKSRCSQQVNGCNSSNQLCPEHSCLHFWIGLYSNKNCGNNCGGDIKEKRKDWMWMDGTDYNPDATLWADSKPYGVNRVNKIRMGIFNSSMKFYIGDQTNENQLYGYICSKVAEQVILSRPTPSSTVSQEISDETNSGMTQSKNTSLIIGLAAGLGGGVLLIIVIVGLIIIIVNIRKKRNAEVVKGRSPIILETNQSHIQDTAGNNNSAKSPNYETMHKSRNSAHVYRSISPNGTPNTN